MHDFVFNAHSGLRYLILLIGALTALVALVGLLQKQPAGRTGLLLLRIFVILLDIQVLLGILNLITGRFFPQLIGHLVLMIAAVAFAHLASVRLKKAVPATRGNGQLLIAALLPLALIIGGILALQRPII